MLMFELSIITIFAFRKVILKIILKQSCTLFHRVDSHGPKYSYHYTTLILLQVLGNSCDRLNETDRDKIESLMVRHRLSDLPLTDHNKEKSIQDIVAEVLQQEQQHLMLYLLA